MRGERNRTTQLEGNLQRATDKLGGPHGPDSYTLIIVCDIADACEYVAQCESEECVTGTTANGFLCPNSSCHIMGNADV